VGAPQDELHRGFGLSTTTYVVIASMVGVGILTTSGYIIKDTASHTMMLGLWLLGGVLALCGALTVAELAAAMPYAGGEYVFIREAYGSMWAFLYGWVSFVIGFSAPAAIAAHGAAMYLLAPWLGDDSTPIATRGLAVLIVLVFTGVHLRGQAAGSRAQDLSTIAKLVPLLAIAVGGFVLGRGDLQHLKPDVPAGPVPWAPLGISLVYVMFSYSGWNAATYLAGEVKDPGRILPRALLLGCGGVIGLYIVLNLVYVYALPVAELTAMSSRQVEPIAALAANRLFGRWVAAPFSICIGLGLLATVSAYVLIGPRVYYAMARDGLFPAAAGRISPRTGVPAVAILAQAACSLVLLFTGAFKDILTYTGVGLSVSSFFVILAVFVLRIRRPDMPRPFRTTAYPITPLLFLACTAWMIVFAFRSQPHWSTISIGTILGGVPLYFVWKTVGAHRN